MSLNRQADSLFKDQFQQWPQAKESYDALRFVKTRPFKVGELSFKVQFNPARIVSSAAKVDKESIAVRRCFLCKEHRPQQQQGIDYGNYTILINPFPIFPKHLTITHNLHTDQLIEGRFHEMLDLAKELDEYVIFYNGPKCGASAPDHMHFQAGNKGFMPLEDLISLSKKRVIHSDTYSEISYLESGINGVIILKSSDLKQAVRNFEILLKNINKAPQDAEPQFNIHTYYENGIWTTIVYLRVKHRPSHFFREGDEQIMLTPGAVDLGGVLITPMERDYARLDEKIVEEIFSEVLLSYEDTTKLGKQLEVKYKL